MKNFKDYKDVAIYFGTFAPMHKGHLREVQIAKREHDSVLVVVSGYKNDRGDKIGLSLNKRFRYVRELFADDEYVDVEMLCEDNIPEYPNGWEPWLDLLDGIINKVVNKDAKLTIYTGEKEYVDKFNELRPSYNTRLIDRHKVVDISATKIRENPYKYYNCMVQPFRRHFTRKVLLAGSASTGKTTLTKDLGKLYDAPVSPEYARVYQEKNDIKDDELKVSDYVSFFEGQWHQTSEAINSKENDRGLIFADTNSTVTMCYVDYYLKGSISKEDYKMLHNNYLCFLRQEEWDLILFTMPNSEYVDDGFRDMTMADQKIRDEFTKHMLDMFKEAGLGDKIVVLDNKEDMFIKNYRDAIKAIKDRLDIDVAEI